jgi:hypothetical protein
MKASHLPRVVTTNLALSLMVLACSWFASSPSPTPIVEPLKVEAADSTLALTVYNKGTALVRDRRQFRLEDGFNQISFRDVAAQIDPTSVLFKSLTDPEGTIVLEQNYEFDLVGAAALLEKYLDEEIVVVTEDGTTYEGTLLSGRNDIILQGSDGSVTVVKLDTVQEFSFPELPDGLITKPTLVWQLVAEKAGTQDVEITYLSGGLSWQADYVLLLTAEENAIDLDGWVTLQNTSGTTFRDAQLKLIAGDLQREPGVGGAVDEIFFEAERLASAPVEEREFFEYHLYEVPRLVTVRDNESKQIEFVTGVDVPAEKFFVYDGAACYGNPWYCHFYGYPQTDPSYGIATNTKVMVMLEFDTELVEADLPRGRVRVYQEDIDGAALLIGEDTIDHTPEGESVRLYVGDAFDIVGERIQTDFRRPSTKRLEEDFEITLRNHKDEAVEVRVVEHLFRWSEWRILSANADYTKMDSSTIEFRVTVPADGERTIRYSVRYQWP